MANTTARIKKTGKNFEIMVDLEDALKFKKGLSTFIQAETEFIFKDIKKGEKASEKELKDAFNTIDINEIVKKIVKDGDIQTTQEYRDAEQEKRFKQVVDFLTKNAYDPQTGRPHTAERIKNALEQANVN
ncbi:MAG TPA: ribosome assembly factor SBDS, partial [Candidatus Pacearchaeota archaeon]|nr:ribosome assembly factor SBDS [Candidatus Pacearchaeota archaeon]